jgi:hypothetical protein
MVAGVRPRTNLRAGLVRVCDGLACLPPLNETGGSLPSGQVIAQDDLVMPTAPLA